jgi:hypothetical protein
MEALGNPITEETIIPEMSKDTSTINHSCGFKIL